MNKGTFSFFAHIPTCLLPPILLPLLLYPYQKAANDASQLPVSRIPGGFGSLYNLLCMLVVEDGGAGPGVQRITTDNAGFAGHASMFLRISQQTR